MAECGECHVFQGSSRGWVGALLLAGAIVFCPCHLPITAGLLLFLGAGTFVAGNLALAAGLMSALFLLFVGTAFVWLIRHRDHEAAFEEHLAHHAVHGGP